MMNATHVRPLVAVPAPSDEPDDDVFPLIDLIDRARRAADMSHKEMYLVQGYRHASQWTRSMQGCQGYALDLKRLVKLPPRFWVAFLPAFVAELTASWVRHSLEDALVLVRRDEARRGNVRAFGKG